MAKQVEYFFDFVSAYSYVGHSAVLKMIERTGADLLVRPMFLGGVMQATGNRPPGMVAAKGAYLTKDLARCCKRYGITMHMNPNFPMNTRGLTRAAIGLANDPAQQAKFIQAAFDMCWNDPTGIDPNDPVALSVALAKAGFDADQIMALANDPANKGALKANTDEAVERGAFGAPTFFVNGEMYFGHDRLDYVEEALDA